MGNNCVPGLLDKSLGLEFWVLLFSAGPSHSEDSQSWVSGKNFFVQVLSLKGKNRYAIWIKKRVGTF